jgi:hypothetical protein
LNVAAVPETANRSAKPVTAPLDADADGQHTNLSSNAPVASSPKGDSRRLLELF